MKWRDLISEQARSGGVWQLFARAGTFSPRLLPLEEAREAATPQFVAVQFAQEKLAPVSAARSPAIEVRLSNGRSLVVGPNFEVNHLRALLAVVESES